MTSTNGLVGRDDEMSTAVRVLQERDGAGLLVVGPAGIGKSRLVWAAAERAGVRLLVGGCLRLATPLPLLPFADVVRSVLDAAGGPDPAWAADVPPWAREALAGLAPGLATSGAPRSGPAPGPPVDGWAQLQLFEALRVVVAQAGRTQPTVMLVEDVHWADRATLDGLEYLLAPARRTAVPMVITARAEGSRDASAAVDAWLARLPTLPGVVRLDLSDLGESATGRQVAALTGTVPSGVTIRQVHARSGGNPLFTEQIVAHGTVVGEPPPTLVALLRARLAELDPLGRDVLTALAVADRPLEEATLVLLCDSDSDDVVDVLSRLVQVRLVDRTSTDRCMLHHGLLGEVLLGTLPSAVVRRWHGRVADELLAGGTTDAALVAGHLAAARRPAEERLLRVRAGAEAERVGAAAEALTHQQRAIELWGDASASPDELADVFEQAWTNAELTGDRVVAAELAETAWSRLGTVVDTARRVTLLTALGHFRRPTSTAAATAAFEEAVSTPPDPGTREALVRARREYAAMLLSRGDFAGSRRHIAAARALVTDTATRGQAAVLAAIDGWLLAALDDPVGAARCEELLPEAGAGDPATHLEVVGRHGDLLLDSGRLEQAVAEGTAALARADALGLGQTYWAAIVRFDTGEALLERGDVDAAQLLLSGRADEAPRLGFSPGRLMLADVDLRAGRIDAARTFWSVSPARSDETAFRREFALRRLEHAVWDPGVDLGTALDGALEVLTVICRSDQAQFVGPLLALGMRAAADLADAARDTGRSSRAAQRVGQDLRALHDRAARDPFGGHLIPVAAVAHGASWAAEERRARRADDEAVWERAAQAWERLGRPHRAGYARWRCARSAITDRRRRLAARRAIQAARAHARTHAPLRSAVDELAVRARLGQGAELAPVPVPADRLAGTGLTPRERQVLALVAAGRTNAEIGAALFISAKTAGVHVTHILRKLQVRTRVEAAVVAARNA